MRTTGISDPQPIVVGVEGSEPGVAAARWAAAEAARRQIPLRVVHACERLAESRWSTERDTQAAKVDAELGLAAAVRAAHAEAPRVAVNTGLHSADPASVLIQLSDQATMVVVGHRGHGVGSALRELRSPVASTVAAHAHGPVVVVRPSAVSYPTGRGPVVVGMDGSVPADAALGFAFEEAVLRHTSLEVVWAVPVGTPAVCRPQGRAARSVDLAEERLYERVRPWREVYPHVPVIVAVAAAHPANALVRASRDAGLLVVGARRAGRLERSQRGSVSQQLVHLAACPLAVVRAGSRPVAPPGRRRRVERTAPPATGPRSTDPVR